METPTDARRELVDLLPRFLQAWLRGWGGLHPLLAEIGIAPPQFFLLRALIMEADPGTGLTEDAMRADLGNPYATLRPELAHLPTLVEAGYVALDGDLYTVTDAGRMVFKRVEAARHAYLASLTFPGVPMADVARLADTLHWLGEQHWAAPESRNKAHQARIRRAAAPPDAAPLVRLLDAVYALWFARDDAHNAAWREVAFAGPVFDLLTHLWEGKADTQPALVAAVAERQTAADMTAGLRFLVAAGYVQPDGDALRLTPLGRMVRETLEQETDRIYFAPWPAEVDAAWLRDILAAVIAALP